MVDGVPLVELFAQQGAAGSDLRDDGVELAAGGVESAVGRVVAEPHDFGDCGVVVGQAQGGDLAADAVDEQLGAALPNPACGPRVATCIRGEGVIQTDGAADNETSIGDVVGVTGGPLLDLAVDDQRTDAEFGFVGAGSGGVSGCGVGDFVDASERNDVGLGPGGEGERRREHEDSESE
jgi:hypothetical protein